MFGDKARTGGVESGRYEAEELKCKGGSGGRENAAEHGGADQNCTERNRNRQA